MSTPVTSMLTISSQFFHFMKEDLRLHGYVRYVDDYVAFHQDKKILHDIKKKAETYLSEKLRLRVHPKKSQISATKDGITFLGQQIFTTHRRLKRANVLRFRNRLQDRLEIYRQGKLHPDMLECQLNSWLGHAKQADTFRLRKQIYNYLVFTILSDSLSFILEEFKLE